MSGWTLNLKQAPSLRVDARALTPNALAGLAKPDVERLGVGVGHGLVPLAEFFEVRARDDGSLVFVGDLARFDRVGLKYRSFGWLSGLMLLAACSPGGAFWFFSVSASVFSAEVFDIFGIIVLVLK